MKNRNEKIKKKKIKIKILKYNKKNIKNRKINK